MYECKVEECPPSLEAIGKAVEEAAKWEENQRNEADGIGQALQRYPSIIEVLREMVTQPGQVGIDEVRHGKLQLLLYRMQAGWV